MTQTTSSRTLRILIVDDHEAYRLEIRTFLEKHGHHVQEAASAASALPLIEGGGFDFVLLDYRMPEHDGLWLLRTARVPRNTKVLLTTAHSHNVLINEMFRAGAVGYLIKPFDEDDLLRQLTFYSSSHASSTEQN